MQIRKPLLALLGAVLVAPVVATPASASTALCGGATGEQLRMCALAVGIAAGHSVPLQSSALTGNDVSWGINSRGERASNLRKAKSVSGSLGGHGAPTGNVGSVPNGLFVPSYSMLGGVGEATLIDAVNGRNYRATTYRSDARISVNSAGIPAMDAYGSSVWSRTCYQKGAARHLVNDCKTGTTHAVYQNGASRGTKSGASVTFVVPLAYQQYSTNASGGMISVQKRSTGSSRVEASGSGTTLTWKTTWSVANVVTTRVNYGAVRGDSAKFNVTTRRS